MFCRCANVYVSFTTLNLGFKELDVILGDVLNHLGVENRNSTSSDLGTQKKRDEEKQDPYQIKNDKEATQNLMNIIRLGMFGHNKDIWNTIHALAHCSNLMPMFEHLEGKQKVTLAKQTLENICNSQKTCGKSTRCFQDEDDVKEKFDEPLSVNALICLCSFLSYSVDALTIEGKVTIPDVITKITPDENCPSFNKYKI